MRQKSDVTVPLADLSKKEGVRYLHSGRFQSIITRNLAVIWIITFNIDKSPCKITEIMLLQD